MSDAVEQSSKPVYKLHLKCECVEPAPLLINYNMMWHDGDVVCRRCEKFIRHWDAG